MEPTKQSKGEQHIGELMRELQPDSDRYRVLASAKQFKASWAELGERLVDVSQRSLFEEWGFDTFADYCSREIRIRRATAEKLLMAYRFLKREEPAILQRHEEHQPLPDYRSIDLLRRAHEEDNFSPEQYQGLREAIVDEERSHPTVRRQFQDIFRSKEDNGVTNQRQLKAALGAARRLQTAIAPLGELGSRHRTAIELLVADLLQAVEQIGETEETPETWNDG